MHPHHDIAITLPAESRPRLVIVGGGFAGLHLAKLLRDADLQIVMLDRNNFHTFQPLLYQVATAMLEPDSVASSFRKIFQNNENFHFRLAAVERVEPEARRIHTDIGSLDYDYLLIATGARTNFYGMADLERHSFAMKDVSEAIAIRHRILGNFERALLVNDIREREGLMNIVVVGGGPTGLEIAGALGELKHYILPRDYPELDLNRMQIHLIEATDRVLGGMSEKSSRKALRALKKFAISVWLRTRVLSYDGQQVHLSNGKTLNTRLVIWVGGVMGNVPPGLSQAQLAPGGRLKVDEYGRVLGYDRVWALGDVAAMVSEDYPVGHPMLAPVAIGQARNLATNMPAILAGDVESLEPYVYHSRGVMATIGRNHAVVDAGFISYDGFLAWVTWLFVHLLTLVGFRNKIVALVNWAWNYLSYDRGIRLILTPSPARQENQTSEGNEDPSQRQ